MQPTVKTLWATESPGLKAGAFSVVLLRSTHGGGSRAARGCPIGLKAGEGRRAGAKAPFLGALFRHDSSHALIQKRGG